MNEKKQRLTYKAAGVDIKAADRFVAMIKERVAKAWPEAAAEIGGFAGGGKIPFNAKRLVASTDGPGTKIILAAMIEDFSGIGQDVVAMSAVDTYVSGQRPTYLLDSLKVAKLNPELHIEIIKSIIKGCKQAGCVLVGGETAEMPDLFRYNWMVDVDTFVIGFSDPELSFIEVKPGQKVWGWPSYGPGSNGFSLLRKVFKLKEAPSKVRKRLERSWPELGGRTLAEVLLKPTPIWILAIEQKRRHGVKFAGHAHITGGGMPGNIPRILPGNCKIIIDRSSWPRPPIFRLTQELGNVPDKDMDRTFNQGIMVVSIVAEGDIGQPSIGQVERRQGNEPQVEFIGKYNDG